MKAAEQDTRVVQVIGEALLGPEQALREHGGDGAARALRLFIAAARRNGCSVYVGDGANVWPAVHTLDAAHLFRLALEAAPAGARLHAVADEGVPFRAIAEAIADGLHVPARSVSAAEVATLLGGLAHFAQVDNPARSAHTRALLAWEPTHAGLLADLAEGHYFAAR